MSLPSEAERAKSGQKDQLVMEAKVALVEDGPGSYRFTFTATRGELGGRVTVGIEGPPDNRSHEDREQAAKNLALAREFSEACENDRASQERL
jgi:hypothetical protein